MTGGNWLPLYYYVAAGALLLTGSDSMSVLKGLGIFFSVVTMLFIFLTGERWRRHAGLIAAFLFALNPLDILLSSMALPDGLALALLSAALYLLIFHAGSRAHLAVAGLLLAAAAATRYEIWAMLPVLLLFVLLDREHQSLPARWRIAAFLPALAFTLSWLALNSLHGFLGTTVFGQTALQPEIVGERTGLGGPQRAGLFWLLYGANEAALLFLAGAFYLGAWRRKEALPRGLGLLSALLLLFIVLLTVLVASGLMVGSYRYLSYTVVPVVLAAASQVELLARGWFASGRRGAPAGWRVAAAAGVAVLLLVPSMQYSFAGADAVSDLNRPEVGAGLWLHDNVPPGNGTVLVDSPIAAYYSGLPPESLVGSAVLPKNVTRAREYVLGSISYAVFVDYPNFQLVKAFPELRKGRSVGNFIFEYTPNDWRVQFGAHPTYIYKVDRSALTFPATGNLSLRFYDSSAPANGKISALVKGAVLVNAESETVGEGAGFGVPALNWSGRTYFSLSARTEPSGGGCTRTFVLDGVEVGPFHNTTFARVPPAGEVKVRYSLNGTVLSVDVDVSGLPRNATLMVLNEQDGRRYCRYVDFNGNDTIVDFSWKKVTGWYNYLLDVDGRGFRVDYTPEFYNGTTLYLGRETAPDGFDWAGLDYAFDLSAFGGKEFSYNVHLVEG
jgi:hypothetical protein